MFYYNQMDYENIKYDNPSTSKVETIKASGCGVCAPCIAVNNLVGSELYSVSRMTKLSLDCGARDNKQDFCRRLPWQALSRKPHNRNLFFLQYGLVCQNHHIYRCKAAGQ